MQYNMQLIKGTIQYFLARLIKKIFFLLFSLFLIYIFRKKFTRLKKKTCAEFVTISVLSA